MDKKDISTKMPSNKALTNGEKAKLHVAAGYAEQELALAGEYGCRCGRQAGDATGGDGDKIIRRHNVGGLFYRASAAGS